MRHFQYIVCSMVFGLLSGPLFAVDGPSFKPISSFSLSSNPLVIRQPAQPNRPFSVTGQRGAILGQQDGSFELWLLPVKILHNARLTATLEGYETTIDLNEHASEIEVRPDHTTITYSHAGITVKQHMFVPRSASPGVATALVVFEIHAIRPAVMTLQFEPSVERQWPAPNFGRPSASWMRADSGGIYTLATDNPNFFGMVAMPGSDPGPLRPYQERPKTLPLEFHIHYDPAKDDGRFFPLLAAVTGVSGRPELTQAQLRERLLDAASKVPALYRSTADFFDHFFESRLTAHTPDHQLDEAMEWAEIAIEQAKVAYSAGFGLAGGWYTSGDSARPGFGWFFGRDTLWTLYAVNSYGDFQLSREAMSFLLAHQRADGKMMHEYSQTADLVDWEHLPYLYAAADSTPLFVMQMADYVKESGDLSYLREHWNNVKNAYAFTRAHTTHGVYDNSQGTGWVEEWLPKLPHQEIYLAALDQQSSESMAMLARLMNDPSLATEAAQKAKTIGEYLASYRKNDGFYSFSRNSDDTFDGRHTIFPAVAWWSGNLKLPLAGQMLDSWAGPGFATDWGLRSMEQGEQTYDPISYHHGSVWPLYTGWAVLAEYRAGRSQAAFAGLKQNATLTWLQDPGAVTEVLSGEFYQPLGRSSSHQLWSSAMVLTPAVRGLFGVEADRSTGRLRVDPQLPPQWTEATLNNVPFGDARLTVTMHRVGSKLEVEASSEKPVKLCLERSEDFFNEAPCRAVEARSHSLEIPLPPVELGLETEETTVGDSTQQPKVLRQEYGDRYLRLRLQIPGGHSAKLFLRLNGGNVSNVSDVKVTGGERDQSWIRVAGGESAGYSERTVQITW
ncbi:glycogen debranching protein [Edaphobacter sp. HDX4]|uniref:amylo-alpha-1,6-glucosidase n=1 Tax=Edaphobacter sp. HDX4 TaxID=2794064 RepID=UPI002FE531FE